MLKFQCSLKPSPAAIQISYTIHNGGVHDVGIFNRIQRVHPDGTISFDADTAYVELSGGVLFVSKMALPIPPGLNMAAYVPPHASRVAAGSAFTETISLLLPIKVMHPFRRAMLKGQVVADVPASATAVEFRVGAFPCDEQCRLVADNPAHPEALAVSPPGPAVARQELLSQRFSLREPIVVLDYRAVPWP